MLVDLVAGSQNEVAGSQNEVGLGCREREGIYHISYVTVDRETKQGHPEHQQKTVMPSRCLAGSRNEVLWGCGAWS